MNDKEKALAQRAVACKGWRWIQGMKLEDGRRVVGFTADGRELLYCPNGSVGCFDSLKESERLPDFTDPATVGCLTPLVREAHGLLLFLYHQWDDKSLPNPKLWTIAWRDRMYSTSFMFGGVDTELEALVKALEEAD